MGKEFPFSAPDQEAPLDQLIDEIFLKVKAQARRVAYLPERDWDEDRSSTTNLALTILKRRRDRDELLGGGLFGEPVWDMLLDLFAHANIRRKVSVSSLCIASAVPPTTALRHIRIMESQGMIVRSADPRDSRRVFVEISPECYARMDQLLSSWNPCGGMAA